MPAGRVARRPRRTTYGRRRRATTGARRPRATSATTTAPATQSRLRTRAPCRPGVAPSMTSPRGWCETSRMPSASRPGDVRAAGAVVLRKGRVLLVHRPAYDDWSFPKGKLDRGETPPPRPCARWRRRPGCGCGSGVPLAAAAYPNGARTKVVDYWVGRVVGDHDVSGYLVNDEIDEVAWVKVDKAAERLSYKRDRHTLAEALAHRQGDPGAGRAAARPGARSRKAWRSDDRLRPLLVAGRRAGPGRRTACSRRTASPGIVRRRAPAASTPCAPYAEHSGWPLTRTDGLSEEDATARRRARRSSTSSSTPGRTPCCAPTGRCCRRSTTRSASRREHHATGELVVVHHRGGRVRARRAAPRLSGAPGAPYGARRVHVTVRLGRSARIWAPRVHPAFTDTAMTVHLSPLTSEVSRPPEPGASDVNSSSLRRTALPAVAILTVGLTLAACGDNSSSGSSSSGGGTLNGGGATSQANAQTAWRADYQKANGGTDQLRGGRLRHRASRTSPARPTASPAPTPT